MEGAKISTRALDGVRFEDEEGIVRYNTIWHKNVDGIVWESYEGMTEDQFQTNEQTTADRGFYLVFVDGFSVTDTTTGKLVPRSMSSARFRLMKNLRRTPTPQLAKTVSIIKPISNKMVSQGHKLEVVSSYKQDGKVRIASIFLKNNDTDTDWFSNHDMTGVQASLGFGTASLLGYSLKYASGGTMENGEPRFATERVPDLLQQ